MAEPVDLSVVLARFELQGLVLADVVRAEIARR